MITFNLSKEGYVLNYLTTGALTSDFKAPFTDKNQLEFESKMRKLYNVPCEETPVWGSLGEKTAFGGEWSFYANNRNPYINFSYFYYTLTDVKIYALTQLVSESEKTVRARIWSYAKADVWVNGEHVTNIAEPVYKPINHSDFEMKLSEGVNDVFVIIRNFGVRDTRNMFSLQLKDTDGICVTLPGDENELKKLKAAEEWLCALRNDGEKFIATSVPPAEVCVFSDGKKSCWTEGCEFPSGAERFYSISFSVCGQKFERIFDLIHNISLDRMKGEDSLSERLKKNTEYVSTIDFENREEYAGYFALAHYLATGEIDALDIKRIEGTIATVIKRIDCADFALASLFVILKKVPVSDELREKIKAAALSFRYWMDQDGSDAMCFWSENHSLLFFSCQMISGILWPDEYFPRARKYGKEQYAEGYGKVNEWFDVIEHEGFEEFLAGGYLIVTVTALMLVYIYGDEGLKLRAKNLVDRIVREACIQCFDGIHLAPMGRIYRGTLTPFISGLQALLYLIDGNNVCGRDLWLTFLACSDYTLPEDAKSFIYNDTDVTFTSGRAKISTKKTKGYMLTSVASPRKDAVEECPYKNTQYYDVLLMNEWFHGTSLFVPGEYGYQQHLWYAAISNRCYTFVTHPAVEKDLAEGEMRPDYWYGNGIIPAIRQEGSTLYTYFDIPDEHPTKFTHVYWPTFAMDEKVNDKNFKFARVGDSFMALWCSEELVLNNDDAIMDCDWRAYGDTCAWVVRVGTKEEFGSFENFVNEFKRLSLTKENVKNEINK